MATLPITADAAAKLTMWTPTKKIDIFNQIVKYQAGCNQPLRARLAFHNYGSALADIQFIIDAGYRAEKDLESEEWVISIPAQIDPLDGYEKSVLDMNVLPATKAAELLPPAADRRVALFNSYVAQELTKLDPFPFRVYLSFSMFGTDEAELQYIRDKGYIVTRNDVNETWDITLP